MQFGKFGFVVVAMAALSSVPAAANDDDLIEAGKKVFKKCAACHAIGEGAKNKAGPVMNDLLGRQAGSFEGAKFGKDLIAAGEAGLVWDEAQLSEYLLDPKLFLRSFLGNDKAKAKMTFRLKKEDDRAAVIAYLATFSEAIDPPASE